MIREKKISIQLYGFREFRQTFLEFKRNKLPNVIVIYILNRKKQFDKNTNKLIINI